MTHSIGKFINGVTELYVWIFNIIIKYVKKNLIDKKDAINVNQVVKALSIIDDFKYAK